MIPAGTKIEAPDGNGGYVLTEDWLPGTSWNIASMLEAYGDAPKPITGMMMPGYLYSYFEAEVRKFISRNAKASPAR